MNRARSVSQVPKETAFRAMFDENYARVVRYAEGQLSDRSAAEDVAAEVFGIAWQKLDPAAPFGIGWLIRTAMHKTQDSLRARYRRQALLATLAQAAEGRNPPTELEKLALYEALEKLPDKYRHVLELTYWNEFTAGEVAQILRMREGAVWTRLHRARARLRALLEQGEGGEAR